MYYKINLYVATTKIIIKFIIIIIINYSQRVNYLRLHINDHISIPAIARTMTMIILEAFNLVSALLRTS